MVKLLIEYVKVDKQTLEKILREIGELKKLAKEQINVCSKIPVETK